MHIKKAQRFMSNYIEFIKFEYIVFLLVLRMINVPRLVDPFKQ